MCHSKKWIAAAGARVHTRRAAGAALNVHDINARLLLGEKVDLTKHSTAVGTLVRLAQRIGTTRIAKQINGSTLSDYLDGRAESKDDEIVA